MTRNHSTPKTEEEIHEEYIKSVAKDVYKRVEELQNQSTNRNG